MTTILRRRFRNYNFHYQPKSFNPKTNHFANPIASQNSKQNSQKRILFVQDDQIIAIEPQTSKRQSPTDLLRSLLDHFLPQHYTEAKYIDYIHYAKYSFFSSIASTVGGVLSMQSLLYAYGIGSGTAPIMAAGVNWVIKDGLGQIGGVLFASSVNTRFDADPKRWRVISALALDASTFVEILTPLFPLFFLPMASIANIGKNISCFSASASKAGIHYSFAKEENLADITAKGCSQSIAASIVGTTVGVLLSPVIGQTTSGVLMAFACCSAMHFAFTYKALSFVSLPTLSQQRMELVCSKYLQNRTIPTLQEVGEQEKFLLPYNYTCIVNENLEKVIKTSNELLHLRKILGEEKYILKPVVKSNNKVVSYLFLRQDADVEDCFKGYIHAISAQQYLSNSIQNPSNRENNVKIEIDVVKETYEKLGHSMLPSFVNDIKESQWHTHNLLVEDVDSRIEFY